MATRKRRSTKGYKMRSVRSRKMTQKSAEALIQRALRGKGKGSVRRTWGFAKMAADSGNIGVASTLGHIARKKARFAYKYKNDAIFRTAHDAKKFIGG